MVIAYAVLALGEQRLPQRNNPRTWMLPALRRCPATQPVHVDLDEVHAAARAYLTVYRDAPTTDNPHPATALLLARADRTIGPPIPPRPRPPRAPTPAPGPSDTAPATGHKRPGADSADDALVEQIVALEHVPPSTVRKRLRVVRARALSAALADHGACTGRQDLWNAAETATHYLPQGGLSSPQVHAAMRLCATCRQLDLCRQWATNDQYTGIAAGAFYREGAATTRGVAS